MKREIREKFSGLEKRFAAIPGNFRNGFTTQPALALKSGYYFQARECVYESLTLKPPPPPYISGAINAPARTR